MAFSPKQSTQPPAPDTDETKASLLEEIRSLGEKKYELETSIAEAVKVTADVSALEAKRDSLSSESRELESFILASMREVTRLDSAASDRRIEITAAQAHLEQIISKISQSDYRVGELASIRSSMDSEIVRLEARKSELVADISSLEAAMMDVSAKSTAFAAASETRKAELSDLDAQVMDKKTGLEASLSEIRGKILDSQDRLAKSEELVSAAYAKAESIVQDAEDRASESDAGVATAELDLADRQSALAAREGEVSLRESFLEDKVRRLKTAKDDLEKYYNRTIPNLNI